MFGIIGNKIYDKYQTIINITAKDLSNYLSSNHYNNKIIFKLENIKLNWQASNLHFSTDNISLRFRDNHTAIDAQQVTGEINVLSFIFYGKIKIANLIVKNMKITANQLYTATNIMELVGNIGINFDFTKKIKVLEVDAKLSENIDHGISFAIDSIVNIDQQEENIFVTKFKLYNVTNNVRDIIKYLPDYLININLIKWLDHALFSGGIIHNDLLWIKNGDFKWKIKFKDIKLRYASEWPEVENLQATMDIINDDLKIYLDYGDNKGFIMQQPIKSLEAELHNINEDKLAPMLIKAELTAPITKGISFLASNKLRIFNENLIKILPDGNMHLFINLSVPMDVNNIKEIKFFVKGELSDTNNNITTTFVLDQDIFFLEYADLLKVKILLDKNNNIKIENLVLFDQSLGTVRLFNLPNREEIFFDSPVINGELLINTTKHDTLLINFNTLKLKFDEQANYKKLANFTMASTLLSKINNIIINCNNLYLNNMNIGEINLKFAQKQDLLVSGKLNTKDLGFLFKDFNINSKLIQNGDGFINFKLQGDSISNIVGQIEVNINKGVITGIDPGLGRVIGLLSIENIQRRLQLDFTDVTNAGFSFDQLIGSLTINKRDLKVEHLLIQGPSAKMVIIGKMALDSKKVDLFMEVSSKIGATLPLAAAIAAGNPAVGAAVWLFNLISGAKMDDLKIQKYKIIGTWENPEIIGL